MHTIFSIRPVMERRAGLSRGAGPVLTSLLVASLLCGCAVGVTHERRVVSSAMLKDIEMSPDGNQVAIGVMVDQFHRPNTLGQFPDGGIRLNVKNTFEVLLFDLRRRDGLTGLTAIKRHPEEEGRLLYWDSTGIVVAHGSGRSYRHVRIDPVSGRLQPLPARATREVLARYAVLHSGSSMWDDLRRRRVHDVVGQFFLWNPETRHDEYLFDLPTIWDGHRDSRVDYLGADRHAARLRDGFLKIWDATVRQEPDSVRVILETYAPRPGAYSRSYRIELTVSAPDTIAIKHDVSRSVDLQLPSKTRQLEPLTTRVDVAVAYADLRRELLPYVQYFGWCYDSVRTGMTVQLRPMAMPMDSMDVDSTFYRPAWQPVSIRVPARKPFFVRPG